MQLAQQVEHHTTENNKRIAKNTMLLYFRMLFTMGVSLYTSRIILNTLGVEDFGIYNVVGGVVSMFAFLNGAMASATQRFLTFELGIGNKEKLKKIFNSSIIIHAFIAIIILILGETVGLWFLNTQMTIPVERMDAARWVYQFSILSCMIMIMSVPYNAVIIANEKMSAFAYISIMDIMLKLFVVLFLDYIGFDKLIFYAIMLFFISFISRIIYGIYCKKHFEETKFEFLWDKNLFKEMATFASWSFIGHFAGIAMTQGLNILLNVFFGPVVNAARGVTMQVQNAINGFAFNFQTALNPQITKSYASKDLKYMHSLIFNSSKYSYFLLLTFSLPVLIETELILTWWLKIVPEHTINFLRIILLTTLIDALANPLIISAQATGFIKKIEIVLSGILLLIFPISYTVLKLGGAPEAVFFVYFGIMLLAQVVRLFLIKPMIKLSLKSYLHEVVLKISLVTILAIMLPLCLFYLLPKNWWSFLLVCSACLISVATMIYLIGLQKEEQLFVKDKLRILRLSLRRIIN